MFYFQKEESFGDSFNRNLTHSSTSQEIPHKLLLFLLVLPHDVLLQL